MHAIILVLALEAVRTSLLDDLRSHGLTLVRAAMDGSTTRDSLDARLDAIRSDPGDGGLLGLVVFDATSAKPHLVGDLPVLDDLAEGGDDAARWRPEVPALDTLWPPAESGLSVTVGARLAGDRVAATLAWLTWTGAIGAVLAAVLVAIFIGRKMDSLFAGPIRKITKRIDQATLEPEHLRRQIRPETFVGEPGALGSAVNRLLEITAASLEEARTLAKFPSENPHPVMRVSAEGVLLFANPASRPIYRHWRIQPGDLLPDHWREITAATLKNCAGQQIEERVDDRVYNLMPTPVPEAGYVNIFGRDITESQAAMERIEFLANYDVLTGLPNRTLFTGLLKRILTDSQRRHEYVAVMLLDIKGFKNINDSFGQEVGDKTLIAIADRLRSCSREADVVARISGDEFGLIQVGLQSPDLAETQAQRIMDAFFEPLIVDDHKVIVSCSIGVATYPDDAQDDQKLIANTVLALNQAQQQDQPSYQFYDPGLDATVRALRDLKEDLKAAISDDQLVLHYQPKISLTTGAVVGAEALIRWRHPERGLVPPSEFIPVAERSGLISAIGQWALRKACTDFARLHGRGFPHLTVAVNLSAIQLRDRDFGNSVKAVLEDTGCDPGCLELEVTESTMMENIDVAIDNLGALHRLGTKIAIDDFGTGYSSLSQLRHLPLDKIKIDRSLVMDIESDEHAATIARTIMALGQSLKLTLIAEGIETQHQKTFLTEHGCQEGQGFLICRPVPAPDFEAFVRTNSGSSGGENPVPK